MQQTRVKTGPGAGRGRLGVFVGFSVAVVLAVGAFGWWATVGRPPGNAETDRVASVVADAVSYPRQTSAEGLHRAVLATAAGSGGRVQVLVAEPLTAPRLQDPLARLVLRVEVEESVDGPFDLRQAPVIVVACYDARFSFYGIVGGPDRIDCPADVTPAPAPPPIVVPTLAADADDRLRQALEAMPAADRADATLVGEVVTRLELADEPPAVVQVDGAVGIAYRVGDDCLMARIVPGDGSDPSSASDSSGTTSGAAAGSDRIEVWRPPAVTVAPGEAGCAATVAAVGDAQRSPH